MNVSVSNTLDQLGFIKERPKPTWGYALVHYGGNEIVTQDRVLYVSPLDMRARNGMSQLQIQLLTALCSVYGADALDLLSLGAFPAVARKWLKEADLPIRVLDGIFPRLAHLNEQLWYGGGVILCNKLRWIHRFYFPLRTPLPRAWLRDYELIVCYYPWAHRLLALERAGSKVILDLGDVMADRHERIGVRRWISLSSRDEAAILHSGARCVAVSNEDAKEFEQLYGIRPGVLGFVPPDFVELLQISAIEPLPRVGFMGAPSHQNEEIMRLLADPRFLGALAHEGVELIVAGGICDTADSTVLRTLASGGAKVLGRIQSTGDYYRQIGVIVNPVGPTTGVKIKSVEALVAGRSLITTRWGADPALNDAFPGQIEYVDWPVDPRGLAELAIRLACRARPANMQSAASAYVERATESLRELHAVRPVNRFLNPRN